MKTVSMILTMLVIAAAPALARPSHRTRRLSREVRHLVGALAPHMRVGVAILDLPSGQRVEVDAAAPYPLASVFKLPVMAVLAHQLQKGQGGLTLDTELTITESHKCIGSGRLKNVPDGTRITLRRCVELMETISDNTAADMVFERVGLDAVDRTMHAWGFRSCHIFMTNREAWLLSLGLGPGLQGLSPIRMARRWLSWSQSRRRRAAREVDRKYRGMTVARLQALENASRSESQHQEDVIAADMDNTCSPADIAGLLARLVERKLLDRHWTDYCLGVLAGQRYNSRIPRGLPAGTIVYHKTGTLAGIRNDAGAIDLGGGHFLVVVVFVRDIARGWQDRADDLITSIARLAYRTYR